MPIATSYDRLLAAARRVQYLNHLISIASSHPLKAFSRDHTIYAYKWSIEKDEYSEIKQAKGMDVDLFTSSLLYGEDSQCPLYIYASILPNNIIFHSFDLKSALL